MLQEEFQGGLTAAAREHHLNKSLSPVLFASEESLERNNSQTYQTTNPFNGEVVRAFDGYTDRQMEQMLATPRKPSGKSGLESRFGNIIGMAGALMLEQKEKFARLATLETGKRIGTSRGEVELSASILKYYADNTERFLARRPLNSIAGEATLVFAARGSSTGN